MNNTTVTYQGIGFSGLLAIVFIILKLLNVINWSWIWVLAPIWIPFISALILYVITFIFMIKTTSLSRRRFR